MHDTVTSIYFRAICETRITEEHINQVLGIKTPIFMLGKYTIAQIDRADHAGYAQKTKIRNQFVFVELRPFFRFSKPFTTEQ